MKVMFVGGGRRVSLAKRFKNAGFEVFSYETDINCPISTVATVISGKKWDNAQIEQHLLENFSKLSIDVAIPLQDHATVILSRIANKAIANGTDIPTASEFVNNLCLNKKVFEQTLINYDFYPSVNDNCDKVIIKPVFGFGSRGIKIIEYNDYVNMNIDPGFIVQKFIDSGYEISVDAYFNKYSKMVDAVPRKRLEIQGGEVSKSITLSKNIFNVIDITKEIGEKFGLIGPTCFQFVIDNNKAFIMEINARFGGGVILSLESGFDIISLIKQEYIDGIIPNQQCFNWKQNFSMVRYFQEFFYE